MLSQGLNRWILTHSFETEQSLNLNKKINAFSEWNGKVTIPVNVNPSDRHDLHLKRELRDVMTWANVSEPEVTAPIPTMMGQTIIVSKALKNLIFKFKTVNFFIYEMEVKKEEKKYPYFLLLPQNDIDLTDYDKTTFLVKDKFKKEGSKKVYEKGIKFKNSEVFKQQWKKYYFDKKECIPFEKLYLNDNYDLFYNSEGPFIISEALKIEIEKANLKVDILELKKYSKLDFIAPNQREIPNTEDIKASSKKPKPTSTIEKNNTTIKETRVTFPDHLKFSTQQEIDQFKVYYPDCKEIIGNVTITGKIENLNGLDQINAINGSLFLRRVENTLNSLDGLSKLEVLGGELVIYEADGLKSLHGLENLREIQSNKLFLNTPYEMGISIEENKLLEDISALSNIKSTRFNLNLAYNPKLKTLRGLEGFQKVGRFLVIQDNESLEDISALSNLEEVSENILIVRNKSLNNFKGLENLKRTEMVKITNNGKLKNFSNLQQLQQYFEKK